jgi:SAM-dependent methyltransferase
MNKVKEIEFCHLCESRVELMCSKFPGYQEPQTFEIYYCQNCNTSYSLPRCDANSIYELIYQNGISVPGYHRYWKFMDEVKRVKNPLNYLAEEENTYWAVQKAVSEFARVNNNPRIVEIGNGLGYLTYSFRKAGFNIVGLDISETAVNMARQRFGDYYIAGDLFKYSVENSGLFDIVILTEVIEHVENITQFILALSKLLQPDGQIILTTPNKSFYPSDTIWVSDLPPIHLWWLSEKSMKYISNKLGMNVSFIDFADYYTRDNYTLVKIDTNKNITNRHPVYNVNGGIINPKNRNRLNYRLKLFFIRLNQTQIIRIFYQKMRFLFFKIKYLGYPNIKKCGNQSYILCAILKMNKI